MNITIRTYSEYEIWRDAFLKRDGLKLLFVVGDPGCGKSTSIKSELDADQHRYIKAARLTAFQLYKELYTIRGKAIILDDVEDALRKPDTARLLMALCETDDEARRVAWYGSQSLLKVTKGKKVITVPSEFASTSRVCVISNDWKILTTKLGALLDRGTVLFFEPDAEEIHGFVGDWFKDDEIFSFIGKNLDDIQKPSIRYYVNARDQKRLGLDWQAVLLESWTQERVESATERLVRRLVSDPSFASENDRIAAFEADPAGLKRRSWFNWRKRLGI